MVQQDRIRSGDIAGNIVYAFLTSFVMVYLTDTVGLASGIVGTLIAVSKLLDGFTDIFFGSMIDKTHKLVEKSCVGSDDLIYRTVSYVSGNFRKKFSLEEMAHDLGVSMSCHEYFLKH